jgi:hypothetical protein
MGYGIGWGKDRVFALNTDASPKCAKINVRWSVNV